MPEFSLELGDILTAKFAKAVTVRFEVAEVREDGGYVIRFKDVARVVRGRSTE